MFLPINTCVYQWYYCQGLLFILIQYIYVHKFYPQIQYAHTHASIQKSNWNIKSKVHRFIYSVHWYELEMKSLQMTWLITWILRVRSLCCLSLRSILLSLQIMDQYVRTNCTGTQSPKTLSLVRRWEQFQHMILTLVFTAGAGRMTLQTCDKSKFIITCK